MIVVYLILILVVLTLYCAGSVGIIWLICELMNWPFSIPMAIGVWLIANLVFGFLKQAVKRGDN